MVQLTLCLIAGILLGFYVDTSSGILLAGTIIVLALSGVFLWLKKKKYGQNIPFHVLVMATAILLGMFTVALQQPKNQPHHFSYQYKDGSLLAVKIYKELKPSAKYFRFEAKVLQVDSMAAHGNIILYLNKESTGEKPKIDFEYCTKAKVVEATAPLNPHQFNYKKYLANKGIYQLVYTTSGELIETSTRVHTVYGLAANLRDNINQNLIRNGFKGDALALINALLLGQRQDISEETYNNHVNAGTIHVLAVSGLHVGIILYLLNILLMPLTYFKHGKTLKLISCIALLWCFAIVAGLSASVVRAVTMFSFVYYAYYINRPTNTYNVLAISMFFLLLIKPSFLFDVGFQLSYTAVFAIVFIQPVLVRFWVPKNKILQYFWSLFTVTVAAQLGVLPIGLYYFHQFPGLFFISNLVVLPLIFIILSMALLVVLLSFFVSIPSLVVTFFETLITYLNRFTGLIANQEAFLFRDVPFNWIQVLLAFILIFSFVIWLKLKKFKYLAISLIAVIGFQVFALTEKLARKPSKMIVFHQVGHTGIGFQTDKKLWVKNDENLHSSILKNYKTGENIIETDSIKTINPFDFHGKKVLLVDSLGIYGLSGLSPEVVLLSQSPKVNLERLIETLEPKQIVADGSNYKSYVERWEATCQKTKTPFHFTGEKGAYVLEIE